MKGIFKRELKRGFVNLGGVSMLQRLYKQPKVFFWHGVERAADPLIEAESINVKDFSEQISFIEHHYEVVSVDEFYSRYSSCALNGREAVLTFDDGYENNLTVLAPMLNKKKLPFTVFISTEHVSSQKLFPTSMVRLVVHGTQSREIVVPTLNARFPLENAIQRKYAAQNISLALKTNKLFFVNQVVKDLSASIPVEELNSLVEKYKSLRPMTWEQVRELSGQGATIGSHCMEHICCHQNQEENEVKKQIYNSKQIIEEKLGQACDYFAFPNGDYSDYSVECVREAGYKMGFITKNLKVDPAKKQEYVMPRFSSPFDPNTFKILSSRPSRN